jgi:uncharacterized protein YoxC
MSEDSKNVSDVRAPDTIELIASTMTEFRQDMEHFDAIGIKIAVKTRFIMRLVFTTLILSSVYLVFMIMDMADNMNAMTARLEEMYSNFGAMSHDMHAIAATVNAMEKDITGIPVIADSMYQINGEVGYMTGSVSKINLSITAIDKDMTGINTSMQEMTGRLYNMSNSVNSMRYDVNEMSLPMNFGPLDDFWPR